MRLIFIGEVFLTEVPEEDFRSGVALENMSHEPLAFLSGSFKGSQLRWVTVDKEGLAIVNTFQHSYAQGECRMNALMHVAEDVQGLSLIHI